MYSRYQQGDPNEPVKVGILKALAIFAAIIPVWLLLEMARLIIIVANLLFCGTHHFTLEMKPKPMYNAYNGEKLKAPDL